jgi:hypothetical protein
MTTRTIPAWLRVAGLILAAGTMSARGAFAQELFPFLGHSPTTWFGSPAVGGSSCSSGTGCGLRPSSASQGSGLVGIWFPRIGPTVPVRKGAPRDFSTARPTYQVPAEPMQRPPLTTTSSNKMAPSSNKESPFYEYREAPARNGVPIQNAPPQGVPSQRPVGISPAGPSRNSNSPFYP